MTKTLDQHKADGTYRADRHGDYSPGEGVPIAPEWLTGDALSLFRELAETLAAEGGACPLDAKRDDYTWNPDEVLVASDRVKYGDKRIHETERGGQRLPGTVWGVPSDGPHWGRVQGNSTERRQGHPNQLPEVYLERLLKAYTNHGDRVLDPFAGSGTTAVVASALGRECVTIDISDANVASVRDRVAIGAVRVEG